MLTDVVPGAGAGDRAGGAGGDGEAAARSRDAALRPRPTTAASAAPRRGWRRPRSPPGPSAACGAGAGAEPAALAFNALAAGQILHTYACRSGSAAQNPVLGARSPGRPPCRSQRSRLGPLRAALSIGRTRALDLTLAAMIGAVPAALRWARSAAAADEIVIDGRAPRSPDAEVGPTEPREESP